MIINKGELIALFNAMSAVKEKLKAVSITSTKVYYPIAKNISSIKDEINILRELDPYHIQSKFDKYKTEKIIEKCIKDEEGNPILIDKDNQKAYYVPDEILAELEADFKNVWEKDYLADMIEANNAFSELLNEEIEIELLEVNIEDLEKRLPELEVDVIDNLLKIITS